MQDYKRIKLIKAMMTIARQKKEYSKIDRLKYLLRQLKKR